MGFPEGQLGEQEEVIQVLDDAPESWSAAMSGLLSDAALRSKMGAVAREIILRDHALDKTLDAYARLYHSLSGKT
jgi:glycosyltransferase involved in cell wall biosynthesis